jgi:hypothetical protein
LLDHLGPALEFPLESSATHPFRFLGWIEPSALTVAAKLTSQFRGSPLEPAKAIFALTGVPEPVGISAPEMPAAVGKKQLDRAPTGSWAQEPPAVPAGHKNTREWNAALSLKRASNGALGPSRIFGIVMRERVAASFAAHP